MCQFFETIQVQDGKAFHLEYHQARVDKTRAAFGLKNKLSLWEYVKDLPKRGLYRLKIEYADEVNKLTCTPYQPKKTESFSLVHTGISYEFKYTNREAIRALLAKDCDDIIMIKDGLLSDTSIANIALKLQGRWFTPKKPLLEGTTRARLLQEGWLEKKDLEIEDLKNMENFAIMNALVGWKEVKNMQMKERF